VVLMSPVQGNEDGFKHAGDHDGAWDISGVNNEKELSRSMDILIGIYQLEQYPTAYGPEHLLVFSNPKDRDKPEFKPFRAAMTGCGWFKPVGGALSTKIVVKNEPTMDTIGEEIPI
jgi:hypothetical protein